MRDQFVQVSVEEGDLILRIVAPSIGAVRAALAACTAALKWYPDSESTDHIVTVKVDWLPGTEKWASDSDEVST